MRRPRLIVGELGYRIWPLSGEWDTKSKCQPGPTIMIEQTIGELLQDKVKLDVEGIDRLYLNAYQPMLQTGGGVTCFFKQHRGAKVASTQLMAPMSHDFVKSIHTFAKNNDIEMVRFQKRQNKDEETQRRLKSFDKDEGVLYIGVAQEKFSTFRVFKKFNRKTGGTFPWLTRSEVMCNQYYFYLVDADFGPLFIKFSSYFPYTARVCLNGHEYAKRQLDKEGIDYEPLDNGILSCADPIRLQPILDELDEAKIEAVVRKWFARLPHPFTPEDRKAGFRYQLSILQAEFARTQVFDRPLSGRRLFEELIRENIDLGRPEKVSLIFQRRITKKTPGTFRTRILTQGVIPTLHVGYKFSKIKQYFKLDRALRTETTINNTRDFGVGRKLDNLPALRAIGFNANRRLLEVETISQDCTLADEVFDKVTQPQTIDGQRVPRLTFGDPRVMALLATLCLFFIPQRFRNAWLREKMAQLLGISLEEYTPGKATYDLRRLRLHGLIERLPHTHQYQATPLGLRVAMLFLKVQHRVLTPGLSQLFDGCPKAPDRPVTKAINNLDQALSQLVSEAKLASV